MTSPAYMDNLLQSTGGNNALIKQQLGIEPQYWNEPLTRIDIPNPLVLNPRLPSGLEAGANSKFIRGGFTSGGAPEIVIDPVKAITTKTSPVTDVNTP